MRGVRVAAGIGTAEVITIGVLLALGAAVIATNVASGRDAERDDQAKSSLRLALSAAKILYVDDRSYQAADPPALRALEPSLHYLRGDRSSRRPSEISVNVGPLPSMWAAAARSASGRCFYVRDVATSGSTYGSGDGPCTGLMAGRVAGGSSFP